MEKNQRRFTHRQGDRDLGINLDLTNQDKAKNAAYFGKKVKGFYVQLTINTTTDVQLQISGTAKNFLGFNFIEMGQGGTLDLNTFSFFVDNEVIIQDANMLAFAKGRVAAGNLYNFEYYAYERPITATANLRFVFLAGATSNNTINVYYQ